MTSKCSKHPLQTNPQHREEEASNNTATAPPQWAMTDTIAKWSGICDAVTIKFCGLDQGRSQCYSEEKRYKLLRRYFKFSRFILYILTIAFRLLLKQMIIYTSTTVIVIETTARGISLKFRYRTLLHKQVLMFSQYSVMNYYL